MELQPHFSRTFSNLLLRLKSNFLWPAMVDNSSPTDDRMNRNWPTNTASS